MVNAGAEFVPDGVSVCVCVPSAEPVNVGAANVIVFAPRAIVVPASAVIVGVPLLLVVNLVPVAAAVVVAFVPAGVPAETADVTCAEVPVKVGAATDPVRVACVPVKLGVEIVPAGVYVPPPVTPGSIPAAEPLINFDLRSGVPLSPSQRCQPEGIFASSPAHIAIKPEGIDASLPAGPVAP